MRSFEAQKAYVVYLFILTVFIILPGCSGGVAGGGSWDKAVVPAVSSTSPVDGSAGAATNTDLTAIFNVAMDPAPFISPSTYTVNKTLNGVVVAPVPGVVTCIGNTVVFNPNNDLTTNGHYTATITTAAKSQAGTVMAASYTWSFTVGIAGSAADTTAPTLIATGAFNGETGLPINRASTATFSEPMNSQTVIDNFSVNESVNGVIGASVPGVVTYVGTTAIFKSNSDLKGNTEYTSTITSAAKDTNGNALISGSRPNPWKWTTIAVAPFKDTVAPTITITNPANRAVNVAVDKKINATFSKAMNPATMLTANFSMKETVSGIDVPGTVAYDVLSHIATFSPLANLKPDNTDYTVTVSNGAQDLSANALVVPALDGLNPWTFKTAAASVPVVPLAINLGRAASFGIASQAGLTSTGVTVVNGDVALYPLAKCTDATGNAGASQTCLTKTYTSTTGMTVNGSIFWAGDTFDNGATASSATTDLNTAWVEGKNKVDTQPAIAGGQLSSPTPYVPGVYHNANLGLAAGGTATFDAQGDANAIFIFKVDSDFVDSGTLLLKSKIVLINGAQARNVWFVAGRDITIGSGTTWNGNILAGRTATIKDGSTVNGRVLAGAAGAGAITLTGAAAPSVTTISVPH